ncbi:MAG: signal peptidase II [Alphaproteobacteria bacterium]|nr:signal peptidase II [Alphaproteobacteria bacterium]
MPETKDEPATSRHQAPDVVSETGDDRAVSGPRLGLGIAAVILVLDQLYKWWMINVYGIRLDERITVTPFLDFVYVINKGISYGLFSQGSDAGQYILAVFAAVVAVILTIWLIRSPHTRASALGIGLVIGGAIGNAIDRLHLGGVADFIQLHAFGFYWYVFNIADVAIVAGVAALLYDSLVPSRKRAANET